MRWEDAPHVLGGRDLVSGGGWIGVSEQGRFAVVTNVAGYPRGDAAPSRGALVADYLRHGALPANTALGTYGGFSLMTIGKEAEYRTNRLAIAHQPFAPGLHGISNGPLDPPWPRTRTLSEALGAWLDNDTSPGELLDLLADETIVVPGERPVFIRDAVYGTRCSTVIAIADDGAGVIIERRFGASGIADGDTRLAFAWPPG
ncbi:hypothetical protein SPMU_33380 [Sphingomonas mucosissima]|uniref:NRDE family protein n=2 Tax=Sphingomonas mucosissima TaxID=370959 RepID=A0A245ZDK6_9SPHN|nr:hypothetical protein SPMU_33380 [Sphingomonas mucosissima]